MPVILRSIADLAVAAAAESLSCEDAVAGLEARDRAAAGNHCAGAFMGGCDGEGYGKDTFLVLQVRVAESWDSHFEQHVVGFEILG